MDHERVDAVVAAFYAAAGRTMQPLTFPVWERACDDLPDVWVGDEHLAEVAGLELLRHSDELVTIRQFRQAYLARCPPMGHARQCECGGEGHVLVDALEDRWRRCPGPLVPLPDPDTAPKELPARPDEATVTAMAEFAERMRAKASRSLQPGPRAPQPPTPGQHRLRPDEPYMAELQRRQGGLRETRQPE